ncbi:MAG: hypothetical protein LBT89_04315 [Planctomycetaceae bacterium]|jgi:hypothetical protein|nr:hypothetical protein [Planctomycetaceae bacterium]
MHWEKYTYDFHSRCTNSGIKFGWKENENGDKIYGIIGKFPFRYFVVLFIIFGTIYSLLFFFVFLQTNMSVFCGIGLILLGMFFWGYVCSIIPIHGDAFVIRSDGTVELLRVKKTVIPNKTTHFELMKPQWRDDDYDLVLFHKNETYYVCHEEAEKCYKTLKTIFEQKLSP